MKFSLAAVLVLLTSAPITAQTVVPARRIVRPAMSPQQVNHLPAEVRARIVQQQATGKTAGTKAAQNPKTPEQKKVDLIIAEKFERTPAAVLKAWSYREPKSATISNAPIKMSGKVLNVFEKFIVVSHEQPKKVEANRLATLAKNGKSIGKLKLLSVEDKKFSGQFETQPGKDAVKINDIVDIVILPTTAKPEAPPNPDAKLKKEVEQFARDVTLGKWDNVKSFIAALSPANGKKVFKHILDSLTAGVAGPTPVIPPGTPPEVAAQIVAQAQAQAEAQAGNANAIQQQNYFSPDDIIGLCNAAPQKNFAESTISQIATLIQKSKASGQTFDKLVEQLQIGTRHFGGKEPKKQLAAANLLFAASLYDDVEKFLPSLETESTRKNIDALKIWSQLAIQLYKSKSVADWLEKAWNVNQSIVALPTAKQSDRDAALANLIELSPQVDKDLGETWINTSFTETPERGIKILTNLGTKSAEMLTNPAANPESQRLNSLRLQNRAVKALIDSSPETAAQWTQAITLLTQNWLGEAGISLQKAAITNQRSYMQIDMYGNYYWVDPQRMAAMRGTPRARAIKIGDLLEIAPGEKWLLLVDDSVKTHLRKTLADLYLNINEEDKAFPYIENIATDHPEIARELIHNFLNIWTKNHDPNTDKRRRNPYIYFYGFDQKAEAIPLTRSKQERNLRELAKWVDRIRQMNIKDIDEKLLAEAFTTCHSSAEVFDLERVRAVFGSLESLQPETVAAICQKMRTNLASNWRDIRNQEQKQTNRREPEVQQEVLRGYKVAKQLATEAMKSSPENWQLHLAMACLMYDENAYAQKVQKSSEFSDRRDAAFAQFQTASDKYAAVAPTLELPKQSSDVFDYWFYASLGACDLGKITDETVPDLRQYKSIRAAIMALPGASAETHMAKFANNMFTRMSPIKPEVKFRYLRGGFEIVGDHPRAWEAKNLYDYYKDLVNEIRLVAEIDGSDNVGHQEPFGLYVNLLHTTEIEREAGGFGKYVQNQNSMMYAFNYGRPTADYRDKFQTSLTQALSEHFEVLSVTFEGPKTMRSRLAPQPGWRVTPYAYILLKPRGPEIDKIPPLKLDLDFLDTSGYVVIPIESPAVVIDANESNAQPRPVNDLVLTQTIDERRADEGKLILEITATAKGLVPKLDEIIDLKKDEFEIANIDDQGVLPTAFDANSDDIQIVSDRSWTVEYRAKAGETAPSKFEFSDTDRTDTSVKFQRYEEADIVAADQTVSLEGKYAKFSWWFLLWLIPVLGVTLGLGGAFVYFLMRPVKETHQEFEMPKDVNPFTVLTLLKRIQERNGIAGEDASELELSIERIEKYYFDQSNGQSEPDDLSAIARDWLAKMN